MECNMNHKCGGVCKKRGDSCDRKNGSSGYMSGCSLSSPSRIDDICSSQFEWDLHLSDGCFPDTETAHACTRDRKVPTVFRWDGNGRDVFLSSSFDNWKTKIPLVRSQTGFMTVVEIPEGTHQYRYLVDGQWKCVMTEPKVDTDCGYQNNVVTVKRSDCDVFECLDFDSGVDKSKEPDDQWTQYIPPRDTGYNYLRAGPPLLPPHLICSVLNQPTPSHLDPTILAEPNHVLLNHLYTLSIKDGVLVLSSTHRYRRKYITTLLYKPI